MDSARARALPPLLGANETSQLSRRFKPDCAVEMNTGIGSSGESGAAQGLRL
jgi:hypothetical protein